VFPQRRPRQSCPSSSRARIARATLHRGLEALSNDKHYIFSAAAHAQRAAIYLHELQPKSAEIDQAA